jgi:uncharacterized membrane protein YdbT with pleckstrin-like domain
MSYIQNSLGAGETVIARARFPWLYAVRAWGAWLLPLAILVALYGRAGGNLDPQAPMTWAMVAVAVWLAWGVIVFIRMMLFRWSTEIGVTSHRFVEKYGLVSMHSNEIALPNIEGVKVNQGLVGRIFGYGTVTIEGTGVDSVTTPAIADPVGFVRAIQTAKEHAAGLSPR